MRRVVASFLVLLVGCAPAPTVRAADTTSTPPRPTETRDAGEPSTMPPAPLPTATSTLPRCADAGGSTDVALCLDRATVYIDPTLGSDEDAAIASEVAADVTAVQHEFAWTLRTRAVIHVYATDTRYVEGLVQTFGYAPVTARWVANNSVGFFEPASRAIVLDWAALSDRRPISAIRHELTHLVTLEACAPHCELVPAWLNEGEARLAEALIAGGDWRLVRVRNEAASMAITHTLLPLGSLVTQTQWNALVDWEGYYKYQEAARTVELLTEDIGDGAIARLYALIRGGSDVAHAYAALSGRSFDEFVNELADRMREGSDGDAIVIAPPPSAADAASFLLYGFPSSAAVTVRIRSRLVDETRVITVSPQGASFGEIEATYPPGDYTIEAVSGDRLSSASFVKHGGRSVRPTSD